MVACYFINAINVREEKLLKRSYATSDFRCVYINLSSIIYQFLEEINHHKIKMKLKKKYAINCTMHNIAYYL